MDEGLMWLYFCIAAGSIMLAMLFFAGIGFFAAIVQLVEIVMDVVDDFLWEHRRMRFWRKKQKEYGDNWGDELMKDLL